MNTNFKIKSENGVGSHLVKEPPVFFNYAMLPMLFCNTKQKLEAPLFNALCQTKVLNIPNEREMTTVRAVKGTKNAWFKEKQKTESELNNHLGIERKICANDPNCHKKLCDGVDKFLCSKNTDNGTFITELVGNLTHKAPKNTISAVISETDYNGFNKKQEIVLEKKGIRMTGDTQLLKQNDNATKMVQQDSVARLIQNKVPNCITYQDDATENI